MSNRRKAGGRVTARRPTARPVGEQGISIDRDGGIIRFAHHDFRSAYTVEWSIRDAREIHRLLGEAIDEPEKDVEYVRESGLIVAGGLAKP
jgi:hypothetical protein